MKRDPIYGMMAEFDSAQRLVDAAKATHQAGYKKIDAYSPFPIEGLAEEIGFHHDRHDRPEWAADAVSPGVQCAPFCDGVEGPVFFDRVFIGQEV